jgi:preprotein translocase subunit SecY
MNQELARRIAVTIGALLLFRLGSNIPIAGLSLQNGLLSTFAVERVSILALNLIPYLSAAILIQLVAMVWGRLNALQRAGEAGRRRIARYTLVLTLVLATFQAFGIASAMENISGLVAEPGDWFLVSTTASMVGGVFFLIWLSELINRHGIGNGLAVILAVSIVVALPADVARVIEVLRTGAASANLVLFHVVFWVAFVALIVRIESARQNIPLEFAARQVGKRLLPRRNAVLPIKLNSAGLLIPVTVAPWLWSLPLAIGAFVFGARQPWLVAAYEHMKFGQPAHLVFGVIAVFVLCFIYTSYVLDPEQAAATLQEQGGVIPGVAPGEATADHLDRTVSLTTVLGAAYLAVVSLIPELFTAWGDMLLPYKISGGSALIVVCTILDIRTQVRDISLTNPGGVRQ